MKKVDVPDSSLPLPKSVLSVLSKYVPICLKKYEKNI